MRKKRTFLVCPKCKRPTTLCCHRSDSSASNSYSCRVCDWQGLAVEANEHEFYTEVITTTEISWHVIDEIVYAFYGNNNVEGYSGKFRLPAFEMVDNGEWSNDSSHRFDVEPKVGDYEKEDAAKFRTDGKPRGLSNGDVLNILCEDGWLVPGSYLVEVCW